MEEQPVHGTNHLLGFLLQDRRERPPVQTVQHWRLLGPCEGQQGRHQVDTRHGHIRMGPWFDVWTAQDEGAPAHPSKASHLPRLNG